MSLPVIALELMVATAHVPRFNENINALAAGALYGIIQSRTVGLRFTVYGGVFRSGGTGVVTVVPEQFIDLIPSTTTYIYYDNDVGTIGSTTSPPSGWPGPITLGTAAYTLVVGADEITSGTCHLTGRKSKGPQGSQGPAGPSGFNIWSQRKRVLQIVGSSSQIGNGSTPGIDYTTVGTGGNIALASTNFYTSVNKDFLMYRSTMNLFSIARGIELNVRFCIDPSGVTPADHRFFAGLYDITPGTPNQTTGQPSAFVNIVGVGNDSTDTLVQVIHNDASGTATKVSLGASFPSKTGGLGGVGRVYDLRLIWEPGASEVSYRVIEASTVTTASGVISTDLPASSQLLGFLTWAGGTTGAASSIPVCQIIANSRL